ncbi:hypothetical protein AKJ09_09379 [Labilithrix luteola]|uniref:Uncharacterized protein n=1 Tax=Labilithrix luteola TaxID=1391654 RepID=A0A0K1QAC1_9BACT|nr:hypothetical protein AKJ09_09379 [Labilithrix luteola]
MEDLAFSELPRLDNLDTLSLTFLPLRIVGIARLAEAAANLRELTLGSEHQTRSADDVAFDKLERLTLEFPRLPSWVRIPRSLRGIALRVAETTDDEVKRVLAACPEDLEDVGLRNTPVSNSILGELVGRPAIKYLDAVGTQITKPALEQFAQKRPGFRCSPRLKPSPGDILIRSRRASSHARFIAHTSGFHDLDRAIHSLRAIPAVVRPIRRWSRALEELTIVSPVSSRVRSVRANDSRFQHANNDVGGKCTDRNARVRVTLSTHGGARKSGYVDREGADGSWEQ